MIIPDTYMPNPISHLQGDRDRRHYEWALDMLKTHACKSWVDIGCWDGWLDFLLLDGMIDVSPKAVGVELVPELALAANRYGNKQFKCLTGAWHDVADGNFKNETFDAAIAFEVLEHVPFSEVAAYVYKIEEKAKLILISLPDQKLTDNPQHCWTPTESLIRAMWEDKKQFNITRFDYPETNIPGNWMISWKV